MKIGIDISQLAYPGTGVATYTQNLVENLLNLNRENEYVLFFSSLRKRVDKSSNFQLPTSNFKSFRFPPIFLEFLWNRLHILPIECLVGSIDVFHTSDWLEPPAGCPKITTVHDMAIFKYPETFFPRGGHDIVENLKQKLRWVKKESRIVIAVSENTKKDIVDILNIPEEKIRVIYEAAAPVFNRPVGKETMGAVRKKHGISGPYILAVGTREPRKNLGRVVEAYEMLTEKNDLSLIIAGKKGWGEERLKAQGSRLKDERIKTLGFVEKEELAALYAGAKCFVYPSLYEGFGLPVLEAMTCGCPVVTSNAGSLSEVGGEAAIYVNPLSSEDIAEGIKKAIATRNGEKQGELKEKMREQAEKFSWEKCAKETLAVYKECAAL